MKFLKELHHPNLVNLHEIINDSASDKYFLVYEYENISI